MMFDSKSQYSDRITNGRVLFFQYYGNIHYMLQAGVYDKYKKLKVPQKIEDGWREELFDDLRRQFCSKASIYEKIIWIGSLLNIGVKTDVVATFICNLLEEDIDTFSRILLCEELKRCSHHNSKGAPKLTIILEDQKKHMLERDITIDAKYYQLSCMSDYDFSDANIKKRINTL